jgi:hypothetical protein
MLADTSVWVDLFNGHRLAPLQAQLTPQVMGKAQSHKHNQGRDEGHVAGYLTGRSAFNGTLRPTL